jgi:hypothetical protein
MGNVPDERVRYFHGVLPLLVAALSLQGCGRPSRDTERAAAGHPVSTAPTAAEGEMVEYTYSGRDQRGLPLVSGTLTLTWDSSHPSEVVGTWAFTRLRNDIDVGPQVGTGQLKGVVNRNGVIVLRLNDMVDNTVHLIGRVTGGEFSGQWQYETDAGITSEGTFVATRRPTMESEKKGEEKGSGVLCLDPLSGV